RQRRTATAGIDRADDAPSSIGSPLWRLWAGGPAPDGYQLVRERTSADLPFDRLLWAGLGAERAADQDRRAAGAPRRSSIAVASRRSLGESTSNSSSGSSTSSRTGSSAATASVTRPVPARAAHASSSSARG